MSTPRNPILIGQAEVIDVLQPEVRTMLQHQGTYLASDSARPGFTVPLVVNADGVWSMEIDGRLDPEHFHKTVRISGPFFAPGEEIDPVTAKDAAFAAAQIDERAVMHGLADRIVGNAAPDEDGRLEVAYAIARYLGLDWPAAAQGINPTDPWRGLYAPELMPELDGVKVWSAIHPDLPQWPNPEDEERALDPLVKAQGFAFAVVDGEYPDEDHVADEPDACAWLANWKPEPPAGEHWRLVMVHDTEDGPAAVFVRPLALIDSTPKGGTDAPNLFWNDADPERAFDSITELVSREWSNGAVVAGDVLEIQQAIRLPNIKVRVVESEDDGVDYEGMKATSAEVRP